MRFIFENIPEETKFLVFDNDDQKICGHYTIPTGSSDWMFDIPASCQSPYYDLAAMEYFIPDSRSPLNIAEPEFTVSGESYYLDITRPAQAEELNRRSVETLITTISRVEQFSGRQKFYTALMALNSYYEYLVHGMLVVSEHCSSSKFERLGVHRKRIDEAFDARNTSFFAEAIRICPGKTVSGLGVSQEARDTSKLIMQKVRDLRNKVAHSWGHRDLPRADLVEFFRQCNVQLHSHLSDEDFYNQAAALFTNLYAQTSVLNTRMSVVTEKEIVRLERFGRGYT